MKILFLDIDGVVALEEDPHKRSIVGDGITIPYSWNLIACGELRNILEATGCEVVLSSDWRKHYRLPEMRDIFNYHSLQADRLVGYTPTSKEYKYGDNLGHARSLEINEWLALHGIRTWCAVDDLNLSSINAEKFVRTRGDDGLIQKGITDKIINILNGKDNGSH